MKHILILAALFAATFASAQTKSVLKDINGGTITESLTIGSGKTLTIASGATINATGATITGFTASAAWGSITGTLSAQTDLQSALNLKAPLATPTFTGQIGSDGDIQGQAAGVTRYGDGSLRFFGGANSAPFHGGTGGALYLYGADASGQHGGNGGSINMYGTAGQNAGSITTTEGGSLTMGTANIAGGDVAGTILTTAGNGSSLTGLTPSQLAQASATNGQVLAWSGSAWAPATATGGVTSITGTANQITVTGTTTPTLSLPSTITGLTSVTSSGYIASGLSLTGSQATNAVDLSATWNTSSAPTGIKLNITDTASASTSLLMDLQVGAASMFSFRKNGIFLARFGYASGASVGIECYDSDSAAMSRTVSSRSAMLGGASIGLRMSSNYAVSWSPTAAGAGDCFGSNDLFLARDAANTLAQRNSTNAQASRIYETDSGSNDEYLEISAAASVNTIKPVATGTGTASTVRYYTTTTVWFGSGSGTPEASQTAGIGSVYTDTATGTLYRKTSGTGNTGWVTP